MQEARLKERDGTALELYLLLTGEIEREAREHDAPILRVDGARDLDETVDAVEQLFADALAAGPRAETTAERRALLRDGNLARVEQVRAFYARPWADGEADRVELEFLCECGDPACTGDVRITVGVAATGPVLAAGHGRVR